MPNNKVLEVKNVDVVFSSGKSFFKAVSNVSFDLRKQEILGLVGESGSGKSTLGRMLMGINSFTKGEVRIKKLRLHHNHRNLKKDEQKYLTKNIQYIFQDPASSLNPSKVIRKALFDIYNHNFKYRDYKKDLIEKKAVQKAFVEKIYKSIFKDEYKKHKVIIYRTDRNGVEELNSDFYVNQSNIMIDYRNAKNNIIAMQKAKKISDKEYSAQRRKLRAQLREDLKANKMQFLPALEKAQEGLKETISYRHTITTINNRIAQLLLKDKLDVKSFKKLLPKKYVKNVNDKLIEEIIDKAKGLAKNISFKPLEELRSAAIDKSVRSASLNFDLLGKKPFTLSGGQQQRAVIAKTLMVKPNILIADEPVSALDVSIQAQIVKTLKNLKDKEGISILFIAHDLDMIKSICDRVLVMYRGSIVEKGTTGEIFENPIHPYTKDLINAIPDIVSNKLFEKPSFTFDRTTKREWNLVQGTHEVFCLPEEFKKWNKAKKVAKNG